MKVVLNQTPQVNNIKTYNKAQIFTTTPVVTLSTDVELPSLSSLSLANFPNVSFGKKFVSKNADMEFLLGQAKKLKCAYCGLPMIPQEEMKEIFQKLERRPNAQSAINYLQYYEGYMHDIESIIFDIFKDASHKSKRDFQDILLEFRPESLRKLKEKQISIMHSANKHIEKMSEPVAAQVRKIRDAALEKIKDDTFGRQPPLEMIKAVKAEGSDLYRVIRVYQSWYKLPYASKDLDAFIVKYSMKPHLDIAKRLLSPSCATIEHIKPSSRCNNESMSNYILVSAQFNNERKSMPLDEYIMLNSDIDIKKNLQKYIDDIIADMGNKKSQFNRRSWYPGKIKKTIEEETSGRVKLNTDALKLTKGQIRENSLPEKLVEKFNLN